MINKIPTLISKIDISKLEHIVKMAPAIKDFFSSYHTESESYLLKIKLSYYPSNHLKVKSYQNLCE